MQSAQQAPRGTRESETNRTNTHKGGLRDRLYRLPQAAGVAIMAVLLALALVVGNARALQKATPKAFWRQGDVESIVEDRVGEARNVLTVANRAGLDANAIHEVELAMDEMEQARTARAISRADQRLTAAVSELTTAKLEGEAASSMLRAADGFAEQGSFLRQEARAYNEEAERAEALYEKLPLKFLLPEPDVYEGI